MNKRTTMLFAVVMLITASVAFGQTPRTALEFNKRGTAYLNDGEYAKAVEDYTQALKLEPTGKNAGVYYFNRGTAYTSLKDYNKAIADFNQAEKLLPNDEDVYAWRGNAYLLKSEPEYNSKHPEENYSRNRSSALADLNRAIQINPNYAWAYGRRALYYGTGEQDKALADFARSIQLNPNDPEVYINRAFLYSFREPEKAAADYTQAIKLSPNEALYYRLRGTTYRDIAAFGSGSASSIASGGGIGNGDYTRAIEDFTQAIKLDPKDHYNYAERGLANFNMKNYANAVTDLEQALKLWTGYKSDYYDKLTSTLADAKKNQTAIMQTPRTAEDFNMRANTYYNSGDYARAIADYTQAIRLEPNSSVYYSNRAGAYFALGDNANAIADNTQAIRFKSDNTYAFFIRGRAYINIKEYDKAIADLNQAIRLDSSHKFAYANRAVAYMSKGDIDNALADCNSALRLDQNLAAAYVTRAMVNIYKSNAAQARADLNTALRLDPNDQTAKQIDELLRQAGY